MSHYRQKNWSSFFNMRSVMLLLCFVFHAVTSSNVSEIITIQRHTDQIDKTLLNIQTKQTAQETKTAAVLSSIISQLNTLKSENANMKSELAALTQETVNTKHELAQLKTDLKSARERIFHLETNVNDTSSEVENMNYKLNTSSGCLNDTMKTIANLRTHINSSKTTFLGELMHLDTKLKTLTGNVTTSDHRLTNLEQHRNLNKIKQDVSTALQQIKTTSKSLTTVKADLNRVKRDVSSASQQIRETKQNLTSLKGTHKQTVFFEASVLKHKQISRDKTIIFDHIVVHRGQGYNASTGVFTVPVSGTYMFQTNIVYAHAPAQQFSIKKGSEVIGEGVVLKFDHENFYVTASAVAFLNKNHKITVSPANWYGYISRATFSGVLVRQN